MKLKKYIMYSSAYLAIALTTQTVVAWYAHYYSPSKGQSFLSIGLVGYAFLIGRIIDAVADPLVAQWSDNSTGKGGRRIPFIKYGALPMVISFVLIWFPFINHQSIYNFYYLLLVMSLFFFFFTVVVAPYLALLPELTPDPDERVTISTYQSVFNIIGLILSSIAAGFLIDNYGHKIMGVVLGLIALIFVYMPVFGVKEKQNKNPQKTKLLSNIKDLLKNRDFVSYQVSNMLVWFSINMLTITIPYIGEVLMGLEESFSGLLLGGTFIVAILTSPLILKLTHKFGKRKIYSLFILIFAFTISLLFLIGRPFLFFDQLWFGYFVIALSGIPVSAVFIIPNAIIADLTIADTEKSGQKREAIYFGIQGLGIKIIMGISSAFTLSFLFDMFGYVESNPTGIYLTAPTAAVLNLAAFYIFIKGYNINEDKIRKINKKI